MQTEINYSPQYVKTFLTDLKSGHIKLIANNWYIVVNKRDIKMSPLSSRGCNQFQENITLYQENDLWQKVIDDLSHHQPSGLIQGPEKGNKQGPPGKQGPEGKQGPPGKQGAEGKQGAPGKQGPVGMHGMKGDRGHTGSAGNTGNTGHMGPMGSTGAMGPTGPTGPTGPSGAVGLTGEKGLRYVGPTGPRGLIGPVGVFERSITYCEKDLGIFFEPSIVDTHMIDIVGISTHEHHKHHEDKCETFGALASFGGGGGSSRMHRQDTFNLSFYNHNNPITFLRADLDQKMMISRVSIGTDSGNIQLKGDVYLKDSDKVSLNRRIQLLEETVVKLTDANNQLYKYLFKHQYPFEIKPINI